MKYIRAFFMSATMFCAIPMPYRKWDDDARPLMTVMLPFVGLLIGILWAAIAYILFILEAPLFITAALLCMVPYVLSGYMHLDGFMDVTDAVRSCRDLEERRRILKDSHAGAFALIGLVLLILLSFALFASAKPAADYKTFVFIPIVSRICSAFFVTVLPPMETSQFSGRYRDGIKKGHVLFLIFLLAFVVVASVLLCGRYALVCPAVLVGYLLALRTAYKSLEGMNGDIAGYSLTIGELCGVAVYALL